MPAQLPALPDQKLVCRKLGQLRKLFLVQDPAAFHGRDHSRFTCFRALKELRGGGTPGAPGVCELYVRPQLPTHQSGSQEKATE